jgi:hypothetical protein
MGIAYKKRKGDKLRRSEELPSVEDLRLLGIVGDASIRHHPAALSLHQCTILILIVALRV